MLPYRNGQRMFLITRCRPRLSRCLRNSPVVPPTSAGRCTPVSTFAPRGIPFAGAKVDDGRRPCGDLPQPLSTGREESTQQPAAPNEGPQAPRLLTSGPVGASNACEHRVYCNCPQPIEDSGWLARPKSRPCPRGTAGQWNRPEARYPTLDRSLRGYDSGSSHARSKMPRQRNERSGSHASASRKKKRAKSDEDVRLVHDRVKSQGVTGLDARRVTPPDLRLGHGGLADFRHLDQPPSSCHFR